MVATGQVVTGGGGGGGPHTHAWSDVTGEPEFALAADLTAGLAGKANASHTHGVVDVTGLQAILDGKAASSHTHAQADITGLTTALNGKAATTVTDALDLRVDALEAAPPAHTHAYSSLTGIPSTFAPSAHTHPTSEVTGLDTTLASLDTRIDTLEAAPSGGGTTLKVRRVRHTTANMTNTTGLNSTSSWVATTVGIALPAAVGDYVELVWDMMHNVSGFLDWVVVGSGGSTIVRACSSDTATPGNEGLPSLYTQPGTFRTAPGPFGFVVTSGDLVSGNVEFRLASKSISGGNVYRSSTYPLVLRAMNYGVVNLS